MDYPTSDEEFEIMHAAELEAMHEMEEEEECFSPPPSCKPKSKRSLDFSETSTPYSTKKCFPNTVVESFEDEPAGHSKHVNESQNSSGVSVGCMPLSDQPTKRTTQELFGDISDLEDSTTPIFSSNKRLKLDTEEEIPKELKQDMLINRIIEMRKHQAFLKPTTALSQPSTCRILEDCMSCRVPQWPFIPIQGYRDQRIYLRLRSDEYFSQQINSMTNCTRGGNFLSIPYAKLKDQANVELTKMKERNNCNGQNADEVKILNSSKELLVEQYKPKNYLELLSDEGTNRSLLQWLKLWDRVVFGRNIPLPLKQNDENKNNWKQQRYSSYKGGHQQLNTELDEHNRPQAKVALLCGPPGLGKTTLAHLIAIQAGYNVVEVNASDDRSPDAFRIQLVASTQMKAVMTDAKRPNCLILDEIDGAPPAAIDVLINFATDKEKSKKGKGKNKKVDGGTKGLLRRPIICICNDVYVPALRPLRQIAFTLHFAPTSSARLGERLVEICRNEGVKTDLGSMMALSEKTNNDIRACLSVLQCIKANTNQVSLTQIQKANVGVKDMQQGLFTVWQGIFQIVKPKTKVFIPDEADKAETAATAPSHDDSSHRARMANVLRIVHGSGDYDRLVQGVYENFPLLTNKSVSLSSLSVALNWFVFHDIVSKEIYANQNFILYPYLMYGFVVWHLMFATYAWPKLTYPHATFEMKQKVTRQNQLLDYCIEGSSAQVKAFITKQSLLLDCIPYLLHVINPNLRTVTSQLLSEKEKDLLHKVVSVMIDYNLNYTQERNQDGLYLYNLDPNLEEVGRFPDWKAERTLSYAGKQMISREIDVERMRRAETSLFKKCPEKDVVINNATAVKSKLEGFTEQRQLSTSTPGKENIDRIPSHLQKLTPKALKTNKSEKATKDFFGRVVEKKSSTINTVVEDEIVKSDIWFYFKEGHNNAVRKTLYMEDLLKPSKWNTF